MKCLTTRKGSKTRQTSKITVAVASETIARTKREETLRPAMQRRTTPLWRLKPPGRESKRLPCWPPEVRTPMMTIRYLERRRRARIIRRMLRLSSSSRKMAVIGGNEAVAKKVDGRASSRKQKLRTRKKKRRRR